MSTFKKIYSALALIAFLIPSLSIAQSTTLNTVTMGTGYTANTSTSTGYAYGFGLQNTSAGPMMLTDVGVFTNAAHANTAFSLYYSSTSLGGALPTAWPATGWTFIATQTPTTVNVGNVTNVLTNLTFVIPIGTTYRFALVPTGTPYYSGSATPNIFSGGGMNLLVGDYQLGGSNVGAIGTLHPRYFCGSVTFKPALNCVDPGFSLPAVMKTVTKPDTICLASVDTLTIDTITQAQGMTYKWQYGPRANGPWTDIGTTSSLKYAVSGAPTSANNFFRAIIYCGTDSIGVTVPDSIYTLSLPNKPTTQDVVRCGGGSVTLTASTTTPGAQIAWYSSTVPPLVPLGLGTSFTTPLLGSSTKFYAQSVQQGNGYSCGSFFDSANVTIKPLPNPSVTISVSPSHIICTNTNVTFTANPIQAGTSPTYTWYRNGLPIPGATGATFSSNTLNNNDTIWVEMLGSLDCTPTTPKESNRFVMVVSNPGSPTVAITRDPSGPICLGTPITIFASGTNTGPNATYQLRVNGLNVGSPSSNPNLAYNNPKNNDQVQVIMTSNSTCATPTIVTSNILNLNVSTPVAEFTIQGSDVFCAPDSVLLQANTGTNYSYQWYRNTNLIPGANNSTYYAKDSAFYSVFVTNELGCDTLSQGQWLHVKAAPDATISSPIQSVFCDSGLIVLNAAMGNQNGYVYQWYRNGQPITQNGTSWFYNATEPGNYKLSINGGNGCSSTSTEITLSKYNMPPATITANGTTLTTMSGYANYEWYFESSPLNINYHEVTATYTGYYKVIVTDANGCRRESQYVFVKGLGIAQDNSTDNISIYPNPTDGRVVINTSKDVHIQLTDVAGKVLIPTHAGKELNLEKYNSGIYILTIFDSKGQVIKIEKINKK